MFFSTVSHAPLLCFLWPLGRSFLVFLLRNVSSGLYSLRRFLRLFRILSGILSNLGAFLWQGLAIFFRSVLIFRILFRSHSADIRTAQNVNFGKETVAFQRLLGSRWSISGSVLEGLQMAPERFLGRPPGAPRALPGWTFLPFISVFLVSFFAPWGCSHGHPSGSFFLCSHWRKGNPGQIPEIQLSRKIPEIRYFPLRVSDGILEVWNVKCEMWNVNSFRQYRLWSGWNPLIPDMSCY